MSTYAPVSGPPWFILWLLIFNVCYALLPLKPRQFNFRWLVAAILCLFAGALQGLIQAVLPPGGEVAYVNVGYLPLYVVFFCAGIMARRSKWLELLAYLKNWE